MEGKDIFAQAETGSGKTCAFALPILEQILRAGKEGKVETNDAPYVVLSPTRELAQQTHRVFEQFGKPLGIESCCVIGGESLERQRTEVEKGSHVLVATPGRMFDLIKQKIVSLEKCQCVVFDEADRLFDMGFKKEIVSILKEAPLDRQLIMLSATSNQDVLRTAYEFKSDPTELRLNADSLLVDDIDHRLALVSREEKFPLLVNILRQREDAYAIVFCNTQVQTHTVAEWLIKMGFKAKPISGRLPQNKRTKLMEEFRSKQITILCCTDVAARGLDIKNVNLVINYDLPQDPAHYVHRIGRTGRAGEEGYALSFCAHEDCEFLDPICDLIETKIKKVDLGDSDFATDICPKPYIDKKTLRVSAPKERNPRTEKRSYPRNEKQAPRQETKKENVAMMKTERRTTAGDKRFLELTSYGLKKAMPEAMSRLRITDDALLGYQVLEEGKRKFFIFGPKETKYKFYVKPIYSKLLLPFLIQTMKLAKLDLYVKVSYRPGSLLISFSGNDEGLLCARKFELLNAFDYLIQNYLQSRVVLHRDMKIKVRCARSNESRPKVENADRRQEEELLIQMGKKIKEQVLASGEPLKLKPMGPRDRRIIHQFFEDDDQVKTVSLGNDHHKEIEFSLR